MKGIIRIGDATTSGGRVLAGSDAIRFDGIGAARQGDPVSCPLPGHGLTTIAEGHPTYREDGQSLAFHGHRCVCGCLLLTSLPDARAS